MSLLCEEGGVLCVICLFCVRAPDLPRVSLVCITLDKQSPASNHRQRHARLSASPYQIDLHQTSSTRKNSARMAQVTRILCFPLSEMAHP